MPRLPRLVLLAVLGTGILVASPDDAHACTCDPTPAEPSERLDIDARVTREIAAADGVQRLRISVLSSRNDNVSAGDVVVLSYRTGDGGACGLGAPLETGATYAVEAVGSVGNFHADLCQGVAAVPTDFADDPDAGASSSDGDGSENRTIGLVTMVVAILGLGFAYLRTKRATKDWND